MGKNQVTLTFAGETKDIESSFDKVGRSAKRMGDDTSSSFDRVGDSADRLDTRAMGFRDTMTGVEDTSRGFSEIMKGNVFDGVLLLGMGVGDLASGVANFGVQFAKQAAEFVANTARMVASHAVGVATTIAGWVAQGAAALVAGAQMALAWLIGLGPIALVIIAIAAIIGILAFLGVGFDDVARIAGMVWNFILGVIQGAFGWLRANWPLVLAILTGPFGLAVLAIVKNWDTIRSTVGNVLGWIRDRVTEAKDWIVGRFNDVVSFISGLPGRISSAASGLFDGLKNAFRSALNWIIGKWNGLSFTLPSVSVFGQTVGGGTISTPNLPTFHGGGTFKAPSGRREGLAMLLDGENVSRPGAGGGPTVKIYVAGSIRSDRDLVKVVEDAFARGDLRPAG